MASDRDLSMEVEAHKKTKAQLAAVTAERDALKKQFDAVPVGAIRTYYRMSEAAIDALAFWEDNQRPFEDAEDAINAWIKSMRESVTEVTP